MNLVEQIDIEIAKLQRVRSILTSDVFQPRSQSTAPTTTTKKRVFSAASRAKMAAAQKARWAAKKAASR